MFSHTSSIERLGAQPQWLMSGGMAAMSPAFMVMTARGAAVILSATCQVISSDN